jgi:hypothetical protein
MSGSIFDAYPQWEAERIRTDAARLSLWGG